MKLISWNVNSLKRRNETGRLDEIFDLNPDIFCIQEVKVNPQNLDDSVVNKDGYESYFNPPSDPELNGSSGVAIYTKVKPISIQQEFGNKFDVQGRIQKIEFEEFILYNVYFPTGNSKKSSPETLEKYEFYEMFQEILNKTEKPQIICGDFNRGVSKKDVYAYSPYTNGFRPEELKWFQNFLNMGYVDSFRLFNKDNGHFTWWWSGDKKRIENQGFRLDYFIVSEELKDNMVNASILYDIYDGDHVPISLELEF